MTDTAPAFEPERILEALDRHGVDYVLIGSLATYLQGSPLPTLDVDVTPAPTPNNFERLSKALFELEARVRTDGAIALTFSDSARSLMSVEMWNLTTKFGDLDIAQMPAGTSGYPDLTRDARALVLSGRRVRVASLADIIRSKDAAGRAKDQLALPVLRELLAREKAP